MKGFLKICNKYFSFLETEFDCKREVLTSEYDSRIYYYNSHCCVLVRHEMEDIFISLARTKNGGIPSYLDENTNSINYINFLSLVSEIDPSASAYYEEVLNKGLKDARLVLEVISDGIHRYAVEPLNGNFSQFENVFQRWGAS